MMQSLDRVGARPWRYDQSELVADGAIHVLGLVLATAGTVVMLATSHGAFLSVAARAVYCATLLLTLTTSALYNLWPVSPLKWHLRRYDHAMIFALIAGTYTPLMSRIATLETTVVLWGVWIISLLGIGLKLADVGRREWLSTALYVALGWSGVFAIQTLISHLPRTSLILVVIGGLLYSVGTLFHHWRSLRFQNVIWHAFVLAAAACHYLAILLVTEP